MTKQEAAQFLGVSTRAIERYVSAGKLHVTYENRARGGQETVFDQTEVEALKSKINEAKEVKATPVKKETQDEPSKSLVTVSSSRQAVEQIAQLLSEMRTNKPPVVPTSDKLTLSLLEASALSGLSVNWLRDAIKSGGLKAAKRGKGWNIKRTDLEMYIEGL